MLHSTFRNLALSLLLLPGLAEAEIIKIPVGQQQGVEAGIRLPPRGQSTDLVRQHHGEPSRAYAAVGSPPITRWDYPAFTVYFEHNHVVHAVYLTMAKRVQ